MKMYRYSASLLCEQMPLNELLAQLDIDHNGAEVDNRLNLFEKRRDTSDIFRLLC